MPYRRFFLFEQVVADDERVFLRRNGRFEKLLGPGKYTELDFHRELSAEVVKIVRAEIPASVALMMKVAHPQVVEDNFEIIQTGPSQIAIVSFDGDPTHIVAPNTTRAFWKTLTRVNVEMIETGEPRIQKKHLDRIDLSRTVMVKHVTVEPHEAALLIIDGQLQQTLGPGRHAFWNQPFKIEVETFDVNAVKFEHPKIEPVRRDHGGQHR